MLRRVRDSLFIVVACAVMGCSTTLRMRSGQEESGDIERVDQDFVYVVLEEPKTLREAQRRSGYAQAWLGPEGERGEGERLHRIHRSNIEDMSFPGRAAGIAGSVLLTAGLGVALGGLLTAAACDGDFCAFAHILITLPGGVVFLAGAATMIPGWVIYANEAADARPATTVRLSPIASLGGEDAGGGLGTTVTW